MFRKTMENVGNGMVLKMEITKYLNLGDNIDRRI